MIQPAADLTLILSNRSDLQARALLLGDRLDLK